MAEAGRQDGGAQSLSSSAFATTADYIHRQRASTYTGG